MGVAARHRNPALTAFSHPCRCATFRCRARCSTRRGTVVAGRRFSGRPGRWISSMPRVWPCRRGTAPVVLTVHDLACLHANRLAYPHGVALFPRRVNLAGGDLVLCSSAATEADCRAAGFAAAKLRVVPLGVRHPPAGPRSWRRVPATAWTGLSCCGRARSGPAEPAGRGRGVPAARSARSGPRAGRADGLERRPRQNSPPVAAQCVPGSCPVPPWKALYAAAGVLLPFPPRGFRAAVAEAMARERRWSPPR